MLVEIIGHSGAGKTTLMNNIISKMNKKAERAYSATDYLYKSMRLHIIRSYKLKNVILTFLLLPYFFKSLSLSVIRTFVLFSVITILENPTRDTINRIRNFIIRVASYFVLKDEQKILLLDEGIINTAHNVLVYPHVYPSFEKIQRFLELVPKPDYVIYVSVDYKISMKRSLSRPDPPLKNVPVKQLEGFIRHGYLLFKEFALSPQLCNRCVIVSGEDVELATDLSISFIT